MRECGTRVDGIEVQDVLMTVHREDNDAIGRSSRSDSWHIAIGFNGNLQLVSLSALNIKAPRRNDGVVFAGFGILISVGSGVYFIGFQRGVTTHKHLQGIFLDLSLIVFKPAKHATVGRETEGTAGGELFFVDPIGDTVDDFTLFAVFCDLTFSIVVEEFHEEDVVVSDESNLITVG